MKTPGLVILTMSVAILSGCLTTDSNITTGHVRIGQHTIILSGERIYVWDREEIKNILSTYEDQALFRIQQYYNGKPQGRIGEMRDVEVGEKLIAESDAYARKVGLTSWTTRIGLSDRDWQAEQEGHARMKAAHAGGGGHHGGHGGHHPSNHPVPRAGTLCSTSCPPPRASDHLVKEITPILKRYQ